MKKRITLLILIITCVITRAQTGEWKKYITEYKDLPNSAVRAIAVDSLGIKWFGTGQGLTKFDGKNWTQYNLNNSGLPSNSITAIVVDRDNRKWIGTYNHGLVIYDDKTWVVYNNINSILTSNRVYGLHIDKDNNIWIRTIYGIIKVGLDYWTWVVNPLKQDPNVEYSDISFDKNGKIWFAAYSEGLFSFDGKTWRQYTLSNEKGSRYKFYSVKVTAMGEVYANINDGDFFIKLENDSLVKVKSPFENNSITGIFSMGVGNNEELWAGGYGIIGKYDGKEWKIFKSESSGVPYTIIGLITCHKDTVWLGTENQGAANYSNGKWNRYMASKGLPYDVIDAVAVDSNNAKWVATEKGLGKLEGNNWTVYTNANAPLPSLHIREIKVDKENNVWVLTISGLVKIEGENWKVHRDEKSYGLYDSFDIEADTIWVIKGDSLYKYDGINWKTIKQPSMNFTRVTVDSKGYKWFTTRDTLAKYKDGIWEIFTPENSGLPSYINDFIIDSKGRKWIGTTKGLAIYNDTTWTVYNPANTPMKDYTVNKIKFDSKGRAWLGMSKGLNCFDGVNWKNYNTFDYSIDGVSCIDLAIDKDDNIWIASYRGLHVFNEQKIVSVKEEKEALPTEFKLYQNYPNPFNPSTIISYQTSASGLVSLKVYDVLGREVATLVDEYKQPGYYSVEFRVMSDEYASGVYFYKLETGKYTEIKKMLLVK